MLLFLELMWCCFLRLLTQCTYGRFRRIFRMLCIRPVWPKTRVCCWSRQLLVGTKGCSCSRLPSCRCSGSWWRQEGTLVGTQEPTRGTLAIWGRLSVSASSHTQYGWSLWCSSSMCDVCEPPFPTRKVSWKNAWQFRTHRTYCVRQVCERMR